MQYRQLGRSGIRVSAIGVGMEHIGHQPQVIKDILDHAIDHGINYFDLLISDSMDKEAVGEVIRGRREQVVLAWHLGLAETQGQHSQYRRTRDVGECRQLFDDLLQRLETDHVDVLHIHNADEPDDMESILAPGGILELAQELKRQGKVRLIGHSGHNPRTALKLVQTGALDVIMHPLTIMGSNAGRDELLHTCMCLGVGIIAMKTYGGGAVFEEKIPVTPVQCISYSLAQPGVTTVPVGVRSVSELDSALDYFHASEEARDYTPFVSEHRADLKGRCLYCNHCLPCPVEIDIAQVMRLYEPAQMGISSSLALAYQALAVTPSSCLQCGACTERCPFGVDTSERIGKLATMFDR